MPSPHLQSHRNHNHTTAISSPPSLNHETMPPICNYPKQKSRPYLSAIDPFPVSLTNHRPATTHDQKTTSLLQPQIQSHTHQSSPYTQTVSFQTHSLSAYTLCLYPTHSIHLQITTILVTNSALTKPQTNPICITENGRGRAATVDPSDAATAMDRCPLPSPQLSLPRLLFLRHARCSAVHLHHHVVSLLSLFSKEGTKKMMINERKQHG